MAEPVDYFAGAVLREIQRGKVFNSAEEVMRFFLDTYNLQTGPLEIERTLARLAGLGFISIIQDEYAGTIILNPGQTATLLRASRLAKEEMPPDVVKLLSGGEEIFRRAFANEQFWKDYEKTASDEVEPVSAVNEAPAADRIVTVTHNQFTTINEPLTELENALDRDNGLPDEPGFRERILGYFRAGRELLRAGYFEVQSIYYTLVVGLRLLAERYKEHAIGAMASALLTLVLHELGVDPF